jgi:hypothetical protein
MTGLDEAIQATQNRDAIAIVHKVISDGFPGGPRVSCAVTWGIAAITFAGSGRAVPRVQQLVISEAQADELVRGGAQDDRNGAESRQIEKFVADWGRVP